eukprot:m.250153 g.250153  ORF g.250153 m.250153 type:complete len:53 (+) comp40311_c0_seq2:584-742(+)
MLDIAELLSELERLKVENCSLHEEVSALKNELPKGPENNRAYIQVILPANGC